MLQADRSETAIYAGFTKAGYDPWMRELHKLADKCLKKAGGSVEKALPSFLKAITRGAGLLAAAVGDTLVRMCAEDVLKARKKEMRQGLDHKYHGMTPSDPMSGPASTPSADDAQLAIGREAQKSRGTSALHHVSAERKAAMLGARVSAAATILDTLRAWNGKVWGNMQMCDLPKLIEEGQLVQQQASVDVKLAQLIWTYGGNSEPSKCIRHVVSPQKMEELSTLAQQD